jgi:hypothetical protein
LAEEKKCGQLQPPKKPDRKCMIELDEYQKYLIRKTMHLFFSANRISTIDVVYREVQNTTELSSTKVNVVILNLYWIIIIVSSCYKNK